MEKKMRFKITVDNEVGDLLTRMAKERHQTKSVFIANLVLEHEDGLAQPPIMTEEQFQMLSSTLQKINNRLRSFGMGRKNDDLRETLTSVEGKISKLDEEMTKIVYY